MLIYIIGQLCSLVPLLIPQCQVSEWLHDYSFKRGPDTVELSRKPGQNIQAFPNYKVERPKPDNSLGVLKEIVTADDPCCLCYFLLDGTAVMKEVEVQLVVAEEYQLE